MGVVEICYRFSGAFLGDEALLLFVFPLNLFAISDQYTFGTFLAPHHTRRQDEQPGSHQPCHLSRCHAMYVLSLPESQTASTPFVTPPPPRSLSAFLLICTKWPESSLWTILHSSPTSG